ncbi:MAG: type I-C CRISPR-associated endonuclease Cas1c, partial [Armatimonadota bacterium]
TLVVEIEGEKRLQAPRQHFSDVMLFGNVMFTPGVLQWCSEAGIALTCLSTTGRYVCRMVGPTSGNVLLRMSQYRAADCEDTALGLARDFVAGKLQNMRSTLLRSARDTDDAKAEARLRQAARSMAQAGTALPRMEALNQIRGTEGDASNTYFSVLNCMIRTEDRKMWFYGRTRRPPRDSINALLSFLYALLSHDCRSALEAVGLDPQVGFLHALRPGRPSLALDLMEELRSVVVDRLALTLVNRDQARSEQFIGRPGGSVQMSDDLRRSVIEAYQTLKQREITHHFLEQKVTWGEAPLVQAKLLARRLRGELEQYPAFLYR